MVGEGEVLAYYCGGVDIWWNCYVYGVSNSSFDLLARMAMYDGAGVVVVGGSCGVAGWWRCWSGKDEVKRDECGDGCDGGGDGVVHGAKLQKNQPYGAGLRLVRPPCVERAGLKRCIRVDIDNRFVFCAKKRNFHRS